MSCRDVCMDVDFGFYNEFYADAIRTAKAEHKCGECGRAIEPGEEYERACGKCEGQWFVAKTCADCVAIRKALVCGSWIFGTLYDDLVEHVYPQLAIVGPSECYAEIKSASARAKLAAHFADWLDGQPNEV